MKKVIEVDLGEDEVVWGGLRMEIMWFEVGLRMKLGHVLMVLWIFQVIPVDAEMMDIPYENNRFEPGQESFKPRTAYFCGNFAILSWKSYDLRWKPCDFRWDLGGNDVILGGIEVEMVWVDAV